MAINKILFEKGGFARGLAAYEEYQLHSFKDSWLALMLDLF